MLFDVWRYTISPHDKRLPHLLGLYRQSLERSVQLVSQPGFIFLDRDILQCAQALR